MTTALSSKATLRPSGRRKFLLLANYDSKKNLLTHFRSAFLHGHDAHVANTSFRMSVLNASVSFNGYNLNYTCTGVVYALDA